MMDAFEQLALRRGLRRIIMKNFIATLATTFLCGIPLALGAPFANPEPVTIQGYSGPQEDPSISPDGRYLFFDSHTDSPSIPVEVYYATRYDYKTFTSRGAIRNINPPTGSKEQTLDANMDLSGRLYFTTSVFSPGYPLIVSGPFANGAVAQGTPVKGISPSHAGGFIMQVTVTPDGNTLYYADCGPMGNGGNPNIPSFSRVAVASKNADGSFTKLSNSDVLLANVNAAGNLLYNATASANNLELVFTAADLSLPAYNGYTVYLASRISTSDPFSAPVEVTAAGHNSENGSLSPDGKHLYYHAFAGGDGSTPKIYVLTRP
jgi:hypothetical protein